jgi:CheY-like chemotaxis protein
MAANPWDGPDRTEWDAENRLPAGMAKVLIVDDDPVHRRVCAAYCDLFDMVCQCASSGAQAIEALRHQRFDVVLMDIRMPGMSGLEAARAIRAMPRAADLPIIAVTAATDPADAEHYRAQGMADVVAKPITPSVLFKAIAGVLGRPYQEATGLGAAARA